MKIVSIIGHARSGNNLLASSLYINFYKDVVDISRETYLVRGWSGFEKDKKANQKEIINIPWLGLIKGHNSSLAFLTMSNAKKVVNEVKSNVIYIYRDGRDTLLSLFNLYKTGGSFNKWINQHIIERWAEMIRPWFDYEDIYKVRYCDLVNNFDFIMKDIAKRFSLKFLNKEPIRIKKNIGWNPGKGIIGGYKEIWNKKNLEIYDEVIKKYDLERFLNPDLED